MHFKTPRKNSVLVTGNGISLKEIDYSRLPQDYDIFRCNHFYAEDKYYVGNKIKAAFYVVPYFFNEYYTMEKMIQNNDYECENIVCKMYNFQDRKEKIFRENFKYFFPKAINGYDAFFHKLKDLSDMIDFDFCYEYNTTEMLTGTYAICCAVACGYEKIYLAGMDFTNEKYRYFSEKILKAGDDDKGSTRLHHKNTDLKILDFLQKHYNAKIFSVCPSSSVNHFIPLAPKQNEMCDFKPIIRPQGAIITQLTPPLKATRRYKRLYLESNMIIKFIHELIQVPRRIRHYYSKTKYTR
ncbi:TPA: alpha-2,3 sialyltransferase [Campylobacter coli]|nr:alpha-2,3 sialyltransferase [Campylobacter coli]